MYVLFWFKQRNIRCFFQEKEKTSDMSNSLIVSTVHLFASSRTTDKRLFFYSNLSEKQSLCLVPLVASGAEWITWENVLSGRANVASNKRLRS